MEKYKRNARNQADIDNLQDKQPNKRNKHDGRNALSIHGDSS